MGASFVRGAGLASVRGAGEPLLRTASGRGAGKLLPYLAAVLLATAAAGAAETPARPPNLVVILADDLGYGDVCAYGCPLGGRTPHLDALAAGGVRFTQAYVTAAVCSPSRAGLMTGRYQQRYGHVYNVSPPEVAIRERRGTPLEERFLPSYLAERGYATGMVGKWHLGPSAQHDPLARGFDEFYGSLHSDTHYLDPAPPGAPGATDRPRLHVAETIGEPPEERRSPLNPVLRGRQPVAESEYLVDAFAREAVSFIERHRDQPFLLYVAHHAPHTPLQATDRYYDRFPHIEDEATRIYAAMVAAVDDSVGAIQRALERAGLLESTLVIFASDNGCATYTGACSNGPLLGGKLMPFEGGNRVPFIASWPGTIEPGRVIEEPISTLDLVPTALELAGAAPPADRELDGASLLPLLRGTGPAPRREAFYWQLGRHRAVRLGDWKLVLLHGHPPFLFDLARDPGERHNLAAAHPEKVKALEALHDGWRADHPPALWPTPERIFVPLQDVLDGKPMRPTEEGPHALEITT
jgi:arylsulfatase B